MFLIYVLNDLTKQVEKKSKNIEGCNGKHFCYNWRTTENVLKLKVFMENNIDKMVDRKRF